MTIGCKTGGTGEGVSYRGSHGQTVRVGRSEVTVINKLLRAALTGTMVLSVLRKKPSLVSIRELTIQLKHTSVGSGKSFTGYLHFLSETLQPSCTVCTV